MSVYMGHACICVTKVDQASTDAPYKVDTIKANDNRVIVVHNETIQQWKVLCPFGGTGIHDGLRSRFRKD